MTRAFPLAGARLVALRGRRPRRRAGELVSILGPNGSGKSTLLRVMAGLLAPERAPSSLTGRRSTDRTDRVGLVFQEPRLLPWRDTISNVAFPLELLGMPRDEREAQARAASARRPRRLRGRVPGPAVGRDGAEGRPRTCARAASVGAAARRAVQRARRAHTRERLDLELQALWQRGAMTLVVVTHSIPEAVLLADRVVVLSASPGRVIADIRVDVPGRVV